jgi:hypothetical protein
MELEMIKTLTFSAAAFALAAAGGADAATCSCKSKSSSHKPAAHAVKKSSKHVHTRTCGHTTKVAKAKVNHAKTVVRERVVYVDRPIYVDRPVYVDRPAPIVAAYGPAPVILAPQPTIGVAYGYGYPMAGPVAMAHYAPRVRRVRVYGPRPGPRVVVRGHRAFRR